MHITPPDAVAMQPCKPLGHPFRHACCNLNITALHTTPLAGLMLSREWSMIVDLCWPCCEQAADATKGMMLPGQVMNQKSKQVKNIE